MFICYLITGVFALMTLLCLVVQDDFWFVLACTTGAFLLLDVAGTILALAGMTSWQ